MGRVYDKASHRRNARKAKERDGWTCQRCGTTPADHPLGRSNITAAHIIPPAVGGSNAVSNYVTLCLRCHGMVDGGRRYNR